MSPKTTGAAMARGIANIVTSASHSLNRTSPRLLEPERSGSWPVVIVVDERDSCELDSACPVYTRPDRWMDGHRGTPGR